MRFLTFFVIFIISTNESNAGSWCKAIYNKDISEGEINKQVKKCRNSDNFFLAIHSYYQNSGHLVNSFIAEYCDLRKQIITTNPMDGDPYFTVVCEFRRNSLRK